MSDVSQPSAPPPSAPPSSTPPAQPPPQSEVPVNETPVNQPTPLGDQAPPKSPGEARREAIQRAFDRAKQGQEEAAKTQPQRAKPGMGHNQPPEATEVERAKQPPDKTDKSQQASAQRYREAGRFAKAPESQQPSAVSPGQVRPEDGQPQPRQIQPLAKDAPYREPPGRFTDNAKQEWHVTPEVVRGAVHQMAKEFKGVYDKYRGDVEVMEELRPYHDLAIKQGTSLRKAFDNYYGMEMKLRQDLIGGLDVLVRIYG